MASIGRRFAQAHVWCGAPTNSVLSCFVPRAGRWFNFASNKSGPPHPKIARPKDTSLGRLHGAQGRAASLPRLRTCSTAPPSWLGGARRLRAARALLGRSCGAVAAPVRHRCDTAPVVHGLTLFGRRSVGSLCSAAGLKLGRSPCRHAASEARVSELDHPRPQPTASGEPLLGLLGLLPHGLRGRVSGRSHL